MATAVNPITGNLIRSKGTYTKEYRDGWDRIFGNKDKKQEEENSEIKPEDVINPKE